MTEKVDHGTLPEDIQTSTAGDVVEMPAVPPELDIQQPDMRPRSQSRLRRIGRTVVRFLSRRSLEVDGEPDSTIPELVPDEGDASDPVTKTVAEEIATIGERGYAKEAPWLDEQVQDASRTNMFRYARTNTRLDNNDPEPEDMIVEMTEHQGLVELTDFLRTVASEELEYDSYDISKDAETILHELNFIGQKEYTAAVQGLKDLWVSYLEANPKQQLCILAGVSRMQQKRKSDQFLAESILATFSEDELARYRGRIVTSMESITEAPVDTKVLLVDDWTISGNQLIEAANAVADDEKFGPYRDSLEVNLIAASSKRLDGGLDVLGKSGEYTVPVKAYYRTHEQAQQDGSFLAGESPVSGTHSSGDFGFEQVIGKIVQARNAHGVPTQMPPLCNIVREYRYGKPLVDMNLP